MFNDESDKVLFFLIIFLNVVRIEGQDYLSELPLDVKRIIVNCILTDDSQEKALHAITNLSMVNKEWHAVCGEGQFQETRKKLIKELPNKEARKKVEDYFLQNVHIRPSCNDTMVDFFSSVFFCSPGFCCHEKIKNDYCAHVKKKYGLNVNHELLKTHKYLNTDFEAYESERQCTSLYVPWFALAFYMCLCLKNCSSDSPKYSRGSGFVG
jgi:hypothetical protein